MRIKIPVDEVRETEEDYILSLNLDEWELIEDD